MPFDLERRLRLDLEQAANVAVRLVADPERARRRRLLHPRRDVDARAADVAGRVDAAAEEDRAGVDADAQVELLQALALAEPRREQRRLGEDVEAGADGALGIVLERLVGAEGGEQAVAGVLEDPALARAHELGQADERRVHDGVHLLRVEPLRQLRRADDVHEEDGDGLALLLARASQAKCRELVVERGDRRRDDGIAEDGALRL
jgi:hypothetical protein